MQAPSDTGDSTAGRAACLACGAAAAYNCSACRAAPVCSEACAARYWARTHRHTCALLAQLAPHVAAHLVEHARDLGDGAPLVGARRSGRRRPAPGGGSLRAIDVVRVVDGDTVVDAAGARYRLHGVDAPERAQPAGPEAGRALAALLAEPRDGVTLVRTHGRDRYRRTLATLYRRPRAGGPRVNVNRALVARGWAWAYARTPNDAEGAALLGLEEAARDQRRGLWAADAAPELPQHYRRRVRPPAAGRR